MVTSENGYQAHVIRVVNDMAQFDAQVIEEIKHLFSDFVSSRTQQFDAMRAHLHTAISNIEPLNPNQPFQVFSSANDFITTSLTWTTERSISSFPYTISEIKIVKQSVLLRPGVFANWPGGHRWSWRPALFVITESGYLHCFKEAHGIRAGEERRNEAKSKKWGKSPAADIPPSPEILAAEAAEIPAYEKLKKPATFYRFVEGFGVSKTVLNPIPFFIIISICLNRTGRITVDIVKERPNEHVFEIMVQVKPTAAGITEVKTDKKGRKKLSGWKRYEIKATTEEEMIEWVACLKAKIESVSRALSLSSGKIILTQWPFIK
jgi:hypothetical protein